MMSDPTHYLVEGDILREMILQNEDFGEIPTPDTDEDDLDWLVGEREYYLFMLAFLSLGASATISLLEGAKHARNLQSIYKKMDQQFAINTWKNQKLINSSVENAYTIGKHETAKGLVVDAIWDRTDNHALNFLKNYNFDQVTGLTDDFKRQLRRTIWEGVAKGKSIPQITKQLRATATVQPLQVRSKTTGAVVRTIPAKYRALMIARTETMRARNQGILNTYLQNGITSIVVRSAGDGRVCHNCIYAEANNPYNIYSAPYLPLHPFCRCTYAVDPESLINPLYTVAPSYPNLVTGEIELVDVSNILFE